MKYDNSYPKYRRNTIIAIQNIELIIYLYGVKSEIRTHDTLLRYASLAGKWFRPAHPS